MTLPAPQEAMKKAIRGILGSIGASPTLSSSLVNKGYIYNAYISTLLVKGLNNAFWVLRKPAIENSRAGLFNFPMGRSNIYNSSPSWFAFGTAKGDWELHLCCNCSGASGMQHELDIILLKKQIADDCRHNRRPPALNEVLFLVECKNIGVVDYSLGREFLGLCFEFPIREPWSWRGISRLGALIATLPSVGSRPSAFRLVVARDLIAHAWVEPSKPTFVNDFKKEVVDVLEKALT